MVFYRFPMGGSSCAKPWSLAVTLWAAFHTTSGHAIWALRMSIMPGPWFPLGRGDMLAAAQLALYLCHMSGYEEINDVLDLVTTNAAKVLRVQDTYGIEEGKPADFLVLDAPSAFEALRLLPARLHVFKSGREVAYTTPGKSVIKRQTDQEGEEVTFRLKP